MEATKTATPDSLGLPFVDSHRHPVFEVHRQRRSTLELSLSGVFEFELARGPRERQLCLDFARFPDAVAWPAMKGK